MRDMPTWIIGLRSRITSTCELKRGEEVYEPRRCSWRGSGAHQGNAGKQGAGQGW